MKRYFLLAALLPLLLAGCLPARRSGTPQPGIQRTEPIEPIAPLVFEVVPGQTEIVRFDPPGAGASAELTLSAQVHNPNPFGVRLERVAYQVFLAGEAVARGEVAPERFIAAGAQAPLRLNVVASLEGNTELLRGVAQAFTGAPLPFELEGIVVFTSPSHEFSTSRSTLFSGEVRARQVFEPPQLRLDEAASSVFALRPGVPVVRVVVIARNPGEIGYFLSGRDVVLSLGGESVATLDISPVPVPAGQDSRFELLFYPQPPQLGSEAVGLLNAAMAGIPTSLEVRGDFSVDVLGVASYALPQSTRLSGFVYNAP